MKDNSNLIFILIIVSNIFCLASNVIVLLKGLGVI